MSFYLQMLTALSSNAGQPVENQTLDKDASVWLGQKKGNALCLIF